MTKIPFVLLSACLAAATCLVACKRADMPAAETGAPPVVAADPSPPAAAPSATIAAPETSTATAATPAVGADYPVARDACLAAVAKKTGVAQEKLVATEVLWAQAGVGVTVMVPDAQAPWSCLSDEKGNVQGAAYSGSEGKL